MLHLVDPSFVGTDIFERIRVIQAEAKSYKAKQCIQASIHRKCKEVEWELLRALKRYVFYVDVVILKTVYKYPTVFTDLRYDSFKEPSSASIHHHFSTVPSLCDFFLTQEGTQTNFSRYEKHRSTAFTSIQCRDFLISVFRDFFDASIEEKKISNEQAFISQKLVENASKFPKFIADAYEKICGKSPNRVGYFQEDLKVVISNPFLFGLVDISFYANLSNNEKNYNEMTSSLLTIVGSKVVGEALLYVLDNAGTFEVLDGMDKIFHPLDIKAIPEAANNGVVFVRPFEPASIDDEFFRYLAAVPCINSDTSSFDLVFDLVDFRTKLPEKIIEYLPKPTNFNEVVLFTKLVEVINENGIENIVQEAERQILAFNQVFNQQKKRLTLLKSFLTKTKQISDEIVCYMNVPPNYPERGRFMQTTYRNYLIGNYSNGKISLADDFVQSNTGINVPDPELVSWFTSPIFNDLFNRVRYIFEQNKCPLAKAFLLSYIEDELRELGLTDDKIVLFYQNCGSVLLKSNRDFLKQLANGNGNQVWEAIIPKLVFTDEDK